jgi:hypothetical protein
MTKGELKRALQSAIFNAKCYRKLALMLPEGQTKDLNTALYSAHLCFIACLSGVTTTVYLDSLPADKVSIVEKIIDEFAE